MRVAFRPPGGRLLRCRPELAGVCSGQLVTHPGSQGQWGAGAFLLSARHAASRRWGRLPLFPVCAATRDNVDISTLLQVAPQFRFLRHQRPEVFIQRSVHRTKPSQGASSWGKKNFSIAPPGSGDLFNKQIWLLST